MLLTKEVSNSQFQCLAPFTTKIKSIMANNAWSAVSTWNCPWHKCAQAAAGQGLVCYGWDAHLELGSMLGKKVVTEPKLGSAHPCAVKPIHWPWVLVKESAASTVRHHKRSPGQLMLKSLNSPMGFSKVFLKARWGKRSPRVCDQLMHNSEWLMVR